MISSGENEITNETFISVNNKVTTEFFGFFVVLHEFCRRHVTEVTPGRLKLSNYFGEGRNIYYSTHSNHDGEQTAITRFAFDWAVVQSPA